MWWVHVLPVSVWVYAGYSGFLPQTKDMQVRWTEHSNLSSGLVYGLTGRRYEYSHRCWNGIKYFRRTISLLLRTLLKEHSNFWGNRLIITCYLAGNYFQDIIAPAAPMVQQQSWLLRRNESIVLSQIGLESRNFSFSVGLSTRCNYRRVKL